MAESNVGELRGKKPACAHSAHKHFRGTFSDLASSFIVAFDPLGRAISHGPSPDRAGAVFFSTRILAALIYLTDMLRKLDYWPCIPTRGTKVPAGPDWLHEIKHDGYRLIVQREGKRVRLFTRNGHDWTDRYPLIVEAALRNRATSFVIDGEAVLLGVDGISDFNGLHSRRHDDEVQLYAFDILALGRRGSAEPAADLAQDQPGAAAGAAAGRHLRQRLRTGRDRAGPIPPACKFGLEGLVSKRTDRPIAPADRPTGSR